MMFSEQRKAEIVKILDSEGSLNVKAVAERFGISRESVRKDLRELERHGVLKRTHGGAVLDEQNREHPIGVRSIQEIDAKRSICRVAAQQLRNKDTLFVDNSSTMLCLPQFIPQDLRLTILTNSIGFLNEAAKIQSHNWLIVCLGGVFNPSNYSVYGHTTLQNAEEYCPSKAFFSCAGLAQQNQVADSSLHEIEVKRTMITRAQEAYLLIDATKLQKPGQIYLCGLDDLDYVVTNEKAERIPEYLRQSHLAMLYA